MQKLKSGDIQFEKIRANNGGSLSGCLIGVFGIGFFLLFTGLYAYFNWHRVIPGAMRLFNIEVSRVLEMAGTPVGDSLPAEYLERAYEVKMPRGGLYVKICVSDDDPQGKYRRFLEYLLNDGWNVSKEFGFSEELPDMMQSFPVRLENMRSAEFNRGDRRMGLMVARFNRETVAAIWDIPPPAGGE